MSVETPEYLAMLGRVLKAAGRRLAEADEPELAAFAELYREFDAAMQTAVDGWRRAGRSWTEIGAALGVSKQAAQQRYGSTRTIESAA